MSEEIKSLKNYISTTKNEIFTTFKIETISNLIIYYEDLQQKVKQLEKENEYLKMSNPEQNMEHFRIVNENKRKIDMLRKENHQLENIRKEAIGYIKSVYIPELQEGHICINYKETDYLLNILNKGSENDVKKDNTNNN